VDLFGRIRRSVESARASYEASIEDYRDVLVVLYAEVALQYVEIRTLQERIRLAEKNVELQGETLQLTRDRNAAGLVGDLDVRQAELNLATTEAFIPVLRTSLAEAIHRVGVLLGELPSTLYAEFADPARIPAPPEEIMIGLPTNLLRQRPDIRSAERALAAQTAKIGVATADLYPRLALLGTFEFQALRGHDLIKGSSGAYAYGPSIQWNIFDGGRIRNRIRAEDARTEGALALYENTVLRAFEEVENAIVSYVQESDRRDALARSVVAAREAVELVDTLYRTGLTDFQNVLDTQRSLFAQEDELARSEGFVTQGLIRIYKALGGGWSPPTPTPTPTTTP
ncbi:MAG: efflux transporter outer membrane subunit, partial [Deltaproteobacteria bacterium]